VYRDSLAAWVWAQTGSGDSPLAIVWANDVEAMPPRALGEPLAEHFKGRGLCVFRTGWGRDDLMFSIEAGPYYSVTHNQADKGHFALYGLGRRWAIDSGYGHNLEPAGKAQTVAHYGILVDGEGQALSGASWGTNGRIVEFEDLPRHGYVLADCTEAYNVNDRNVKGPGVERALRHAVFMKPDVAVPGYVVILDDIRKDGNIHIWTWLFHTAEDNEIEVSGELATIRASCGKEPKGSSANHSVTKLWLYAEGGVDFRIDHYDGHPRLHAVTEAVEPRFAAVLVPLASSIRPPGVQMRHDSFGTVLEVRWPTRLDRIQLPQQAFAKPEVTMSLP